MGLDTTHDCWHGGYTSFGVWRTAVADAAGIPLELMEGFALGDRFVPWALLKPDPIHALLNHSDCDGEIAVQDCLPLADRLEQLMPTLKSPSVVWEGRLQTLTQQFINGLRLAASRGESVEFH